MAKLQLFAQLMKVDVANRRVTGVIASEAPDASNEVMDYASSKEHFIAWSDNLAKTSGGKNLGNLRVMHGLTAAGQLVELTFDDQLKKICAVAEITDTNEFNKVLAGTYTGFSVGGKYLKKWRDGDHTRYTAKPREVSLVDAPCIPDATFELMKADGAVEQVKFTKVDAPAKIDPFASVRDALKKVAAATEVIPDPDEAFEAALSGWAAACKSGAQDAIAKAVDAWKKDVDPAGPYTGVTAGAKLDAKLDVIGALLLKKVKDGDEDVVAGLSLAKETVRGQPLEKGMWTCSNLCSLLQNLCCIWTDVTGEARFENDNSPLPAELATAAKEIGRILVAMVQEEVNELFEVVEAKNIILATKPDDLLKAAQDELGASKLAATNLQKRLDDLEAKFKTSTDDLAKANLAITESTAALAKINGEVNDLKKVVEAKDKTIAELNGKIKAPTLRIVDKANDVAQTDAGDVKKVAQVETAGEVDAAATIIKAIHATGGQKAGR